MAQCELCVVGCKLGKKHIRVLEKSTMLQLQDAKGKYEMGQCELCVVGCKLGKKHIRVLQKSTMLQLQDGQGQI